MSTVFAATITDRSVATVIDVEGDLDVASTAGLTGVVQGAMNAGARHIILDLTDLTFIDSIGVGALYRLHQRAERTGAVLILANPPATAMKVFDITGTDRELNIQHA